MQSVLDPENIGAVFSFAFKVLLEKKLFVSSLLCCSVFTLVWVNITQHVIKSLLFRQTTTANT